MSHSKLILESTDDIPNDVQEHLQLLSGVNPMKRLNVFEEYLEGKLRLESRLFGVYPFTGFDSEPQEFVLTAQNVAGIDSFSGDYFARRIGENPEFQSGGNSRNDAQPPVSVESGQVVNVPQASANASIRIVERFYSCVRLYALKPCPEIFREWEFEETTVLEFCGLPAKDRKLYSICIGGRLGSLSEGDCIPNQPIESRAKLISVLTQFERQCVAFDALDRGFGKCDSGNIPPAVFVVSSDRSEAVISKNSGQFGVECDEVICRPIEPAPAILNLRCIAKA